MRLPAPGAPSTPAADVKAFLEATQASEAAAVAQPPAAPPPPKPLPEQLAFIVADVKRQLVSAGRPEAEAEAAGHVVARHFETVAIGWFGGKIGTPEELYRRESPEILGPDMKSQQPRPAAAPRVLGKPRKVDEEKLSLLPFLARRGLRRTPDLEAVLGKKPPVVGLLRKDGLTLDQARAAAVEAGYLAEEGRGGGERHGGGTSTIADLLDAIAAEAKGRKIYRPGFEPVRAREDFERPEDFEPLPEKAEDYSLFFQKATDRQREKLFDEFDDFHAWLLDRYKDNPDPGAKRLIEATGEWLDHVRDKYVPLDAGPVAELRDLMDGMGDDMSQEDERDILEAARSLKLPAEVEPKYGSLYEDLGEVFSVTGLPNRIAAAPAIKKVIKAASAMDDRLTSEEWIAPHELRTLHADVETAIDDADRLHGEEVEKLKAKGGYDEDILLPSEELVDALIKLRDTIDELEPEFERLEGEFGEEFYQRGNATAEKARASISFPEGRRPILRMMEFRQRIELDP